MVIVDVADFVVIVIFRIIGVFNVFLKVVFTPNETKVRV